MENGRRRPAFSGAITRLIPGAAGSPRALDDSPRTPMISILGRQVPGSGTSGLGVRNVRSRGAEREVPGAGTSGLGVRNARSRGLGRQVSGVGTSGPGVWDVRSRGLGRQVPGSGTSGLGGWDIRSRGPERQVSGVGTSGLGVRNVRSRGLGRHVPGCGTSGLAVRDVRSPGADARSRRLGPDRSTPGLDDSPHIPERSQCGRMIQCVEPGNSLCGPDTAHGALWRSGTPPNEMPVGEDSSTERPGCGRLGGWRGRACPERSEGSSPPHGVERFSQPGFQRTFWSLAGLAAGTPPSQPAGRQRSYPTRTLTRRSDRASRPSRPGKSRR